MHSGFGAQFQREKKPVSVKTATLCQVQHRGLLCWIVLLLCYYDDQSVTLKRSLLNLTRNSFFSHFFGEKKKTQWCSVLFFKIPLLFFFYSSLINCRGYCRGYSAAPVNISKYSIQMISDWIPTELQCLRQCLIKFSPWLSYWSAVRRFFEMWQMICLKLFGVVFPCVPILSYSYSVFATYTTITFPSSGPCGAQYVAGAHQYSGFSFYSRASSNSLYSRYYELCFSCTAFTVC